MLITFLLLVVSVTLCRAQQPTTLIAAGATFPATLYQSLSFAFSSEYPDLVLSYTALGSSKGKCRVVGNCASYADAPSIVDVDFAGSDSIHTNADYLLAADLQMYPAVAGAVVAVFNLPGIQDLVLPTDVVADIFRQCRNNTTCNDPGWINLWNDSRIVSANPHIDVAVLTKAGVIQVIVRQDGSGTTEIWKQSLGMFSDAFSAQFHGQLTDSAVWPNTSVTYAKENHGVAAIVLKTPGAIGYVSLQEAITSGNTYAGLGKSILSEDGVLHATNKSVMYALTEKGFAFGNNGDLPEHMTAAVMGARGSEAWPAAGFTYFSTRSNATSVNCMQRRALLQWFEWFYQSASVDAIAHSLGFVTLPAEGKAFVLSKIRSNLHCNGQLVSTMQTNYSVAMPAESRKVEVQVLVSPELHSTFLLYAQSYDSGKSGLARVSISTVRNGGAQLLQVVESHDDNNNMGNRKLVPFAAVPWGIVYNLCEGSGQNTECLTADLDLVLNLDVIGGMLRGDIEYWNAPEIAALQETDAQRALLPAQRIQTITYAKDAREQQVFARLLANRGIEFVHQQQHETGVQQQRSARNFQEASRLVFATRYSFAFGPVNVENVGANTRIARFTNNVKATAANLRACIQPNETSVFAQYNLTNSHAESCWPLTSAHFLSLPSTYSTNQCASQEAQEATLFAAALLNAKTTKDNDPLEALGFAGLVLANDNKGLGFESAFDSLSCYDRSIVNPVVDAQHVPLPLTLVAQTIASILIMFVIAMAIWIKLNKPHMVIKASSPFFMYQMCFGFVLELCAVFPLSVQDINAAEQQQYELDMACMAAPWLYSSGFALVYAGLLVKTWRIYRLFRNPLLQKRFITNSYLIRMQMIFLFPLFAILLTWTLVDPLKWTRNVSSVDPSTGSVVSTIGSCGSDNALYFIGPLIGLCSLFLIGGLVLAWKNRLAPTEFSEGRYVSAAIMTDSELLLIAIPLLVIVASNPIASYTLKVLIIMLSVISTVVIFFYPKFAIVHGYWTTESSNSHVLNGKDHSPGAFNKKVVEDDLSFRRVMSSFRPSKLSSINRRRSANSRIEHQPGTPINAGSLFSLAEAASPPPSLDAKREILQDAVNNNNNFLLFIKHHDNVNEQLD